MNPFATRSYHEVDISTGVVGSDPHQLIQMLLDGALESIRAAEGHLAAGRSTEKARLINRAIRILSEGLRSALDFRAGGTIAEQLGSLYEYMSARLLQANLRNDPAMLREVAALLVQLQTGWRGIAPRAGDAAAAAPHGALAARLGAARPDRRLAYAG